MGAKEGAMTTIDDDADVDAVGLLLFVAITDPTVSGKKQQPTG